MNEANADGPRDQGSVEEMAKEIKRLQAAIAKEERRKAILLAAAAWDNEKGTK
ncbi:hypothetical protein N8766_03940 [bacterium]|nr:hypothetical protein [bacterium]